MILLLHVILIAAIGVLILFFRGIVSYMLWIFLGVTLTVICSAYYFYRRIKAQGKTLKETLKSPLFNGRPVEISLMGGLASFRIGQNAKTPALDTDLSQGPKQLEDPDTVIIRELNELGRLLKNDLITIDEFNILKQQIFKS